MKASTVVIVLFNLILVLFGVASVETYTGLTAIERKVEETSAVSDRVVSLNFELAETIKELKFDVVQVQQWLTDISATRGLDGMNDGKDKAAEFVKLYTENLKKSRELARKLNLPGVLATLDESEAAFGPYYETGQKMADAYVAEGPAGGNKLMGSFDAAAEKMSDVVDHLTTQVREITDKSKADVLLQMSETRQASAHLLQKLVLLLSGSFAVALVASVFAMALFSRRKKSMEGMANTFRQSIQDLSEKLSGASQQLLHQAEGMQNSIVHVNEKTISTTSASVQTSSSIQSVAAAAEELSHSVLEIRSQIGRSNELILQSNQIMGRAETASSDLERSVTNISEVLGLIEGLAGQINMLALNATIESARAGDAGKGFAVVAGEVKNLAVETTKATAQISEKIGEVRVSSRQVLDVLLSLKDSISQISGYAGAIETSVEQQGIASNEIATKMSLAASGTQNISDNLQGVSEITGDNHRTAQNVVDMARHLSTQSRKLEEDVGVFLVNIRRMS